MSIKDIDKFNKSNNSFQVPESKLFSNPMLVP